MRGLPEKPAPVPAPKEMNTMTYRLLTCSVGKEARAGLLVGDTVYDAAGVTRNAAWSSTLGALQEWPEANKAFVAAAERIAAGRSKAQGTPLRKTKLLAPILYPPEIYCAGANYRDHVAEMDRAQGREPGPTMKDLGEKPWHFVKTSRTSVVGPNAAVKVPKWSNAIDWEIELAVVIGKPAKDVPYKKALSYIAGYTIGNDLSARDAGRRPTIPEHSPFRWDWVGQKCFQGACPMGPWIVPASEVKDPHNLGMKLWVGDELMQDSSTNQLIFDICDQIEMLSSRATLLPGDVILTGTPAGVGAGRKRFLKAGETVKLWIEGIGEFSHRMA